MNHIIFGHRGIPTLAPENSLKSFQFVLDNNVQGVEFDIHLTKDNKLVVIHDFNTKKMSNVDLEVAETDYKTLSSLDIGQNQHIPLLEDVFNLLGNRVKYDLEIKNRGLKRGIIVSELLKTIKKFNLEKIVMVTSFDPYLIKEFNKLKSDIPVGIIYSNDKSLPLISRFGFGQFVTKCPIIKPDIKQLKGPLYFIYRWVLKKDIYTWTVNTKEEMEYAYSRGCLGICSDNPQKLKL